MCDLRAEARLRSGFTALNRDIQFFKPNISKRHQIETFASLFASLCRGFRMCWVSGKVNFGRRDMDDVDKTNLHVTGHVDTPDRDWDLDIWQLSRLGASYTHYLRLHILALPPTTTTHFLPYTHTRASRARSSNTMRFSALAAATAALMVPVQSLYFYIDGTNPKCFFERLPKDTLVVGQYQATEFNIDRNAYVPNDNLNIFISVDEVFDNDHRIVSSRGRSNGKFTFTSADSGDHKICFTPSHSKGVGGWLGGQKLGGVKLSLDLAIGTTGDIESTDKGKIGDLVQKVRDLNGRLMDIKREQLFQRVSCPQSQPLDWHVRPK